MQNKVFLLLLCVSLLGLQLFAVDFPLHYRLPLDVNINQVVEDDANIAQELTRAALLSSYGPSWLASYVPQSILSAFVATYNETLSTLLPASSVQIGQARVRSTFQEVPFAIHYPQYQYGTFVWTENHEGQFVLLSIAFHDPKP